MTQASRAKHGYDHTEAFDLMTYRAADGTEEVIWNSRDGVTPFIVRSRDGAEMRHVDWHRDRHAPRWPHEGLEVGDRIFVTMTEESARAWASKYAAKLVADGAYPETERVELERDLVAGCMPGEGPDIVVVDAKLLAELRARIAPLDRRFA